MTSQKLINYLAALNTTENQWSLWVNPCNLDDYVILQHVQNPPNGFINAGNLDSISFGFQSETDALAYIMKGDRYQYHENTVRVNADVIADHYFGNTLGEEFMEALTEDVKNVCNAWAIAEAELFVDDRLPELIEQAIANRLEVELCESSR